MKKLILLLITITTFTNVSYASFPVNQNTQPEVVETNNVELPTYSSDTPVWAILAIACTLISIGLLFNPLAATIIALLGVVFGAIGFNKKLKGLAITGFIFSLLIFILALLLMVVMILSGGLGAAFGG